MNKKRFYIQAVSALLQNANFKGFFTGKLYTGAIKNACVPGLNCYSCPGAVGACPIGAVQDFLRGFKFRIPYYVIGILVFLGALLGRAVCGFLCPFGWIQELLNRIPFFKKNRFKADRYLRLVKYGVLVLLVVVLPIIYLAPVFCKYVCPAGTLAGIVMSISNGLAQGHMGALFNWKVFLLAVVIFTSLIVWRPFCKYLCPLGAFYGLFNKFSLYRLHIDRDKCIGCNACADVCRMNETPAEKPNGPECIRCGDCVCACPNSAISIGIKKKIDV